MASSHQSEPTISREERLRDLANRYRQPLVRYFVRRGMSRETSEDFAQDVFVRLSGADQSTIENAEAYLFTIAANVVVDYFRRLRIEQNAQHELTDAATLPHLALNPGRVFEGREAITRLVQALDELPDRTCEIFLLNRLDGLSYTQLASRYGLNIKSIEKHMSKALAHLRKRFPREDRI